MIAIDVLCELADGNEFREDATFECEEDGLEERCIVKLGPKYTSISLLTEREGWQVPFLRLLARAIASSMTSLKASALAVSNVVTVTVHIHVCGMFFDVLWAEGDGEQVYDPHGACITGAETRFQVWRLVRQLLERKTKQPLRRRAELRVYRRGDIDYCRVSELPEELQRAFGICHAWSPKPYVPEVADACSAEDMKRFLGMLRDGRGYIPPTLRRS